LEEGLDVYEEVVVEQGVGKYIDQFVQVLSVGEKQVEGLEYVDGTRDAIREQFGEHVVFTHQTTHNLTVT
jgi:hypothetical protein